MGKRLRFRLTNAISKVLLINLKRGGRVKPGKKKADLNLHRLKSPEPGREEEVSLITAPPKPSKKSKSKMFRYTCCKQDEAILENCHMKVVPPSAAHESSPEEEVEEETWVREGFWNVYAEVDNKVVKKKVVLKKRSSRILKVSTRNTEASQCSESAEVNLSGRGSSSSFHHHHHHQQQCGGLSSTFRLSTSSNDASLGPESLAWDKEHSLFASDDSGSSSARALTLHRGTSSEVDEDFGKFFGRNPSLSSSSTRSSPRNKPPQHQHQHQHQQRDEILLLSPSTSHHLHHGRVARSRNLESSSKSWEGTRLLTSCSGCSTESSTLKEKTKTKMTRELEVFSEEDEPQGLDCPRARGKVRESVPVMLVSSDPYEDFRKSMVQMITEKRLSRDSDLEELLECYLYLNPPGFHEVIVQVFTDLWLHTLQPEHQVSEKQQLRSRRRTSSFETVSLKS